MKTKKLLFLILLIPCIAAYVVYNNKSEYFLPPYLAGVYISDIDLDGDNDILVGHKTTWGNTNPSISIMKNDLGLFNDIDSSKTFCGNQDEIFAIDVNNDTFPDLVTFNSYFTNNIPSRFIRVWYNDKKGEYIDYTDFNLNTSETYHGICYGDVNGDKNKDLLVYSNNGHIWGILYNNGQGGFNPPIYYSTTYPSYISCKDMNNDGLDDVLVSSDKLRIYYSKHNGTFDIVKLDSNTHSPLVVDYDNDGDQDILGIMSGYFNTIFIYFHENKNSTFTQVAKLIIQPSGGLSIEDINNDSLPDILVTKSNGIRIYYNLGNYQISNANFFEIPDYNTNSIGSRTADIDGNGYKDIVTNRLYTSVNAPDINILFNDGNGGFINEPVKINPAEVAKTINFNVYPNPIEENTTFNLELKLNSKVNISIYDITGKYIETICNQNYTIGNYQWQYSNFPHNGVYIASIKINDKVCQTIKLIKM